MAYDGSNRPIATDRRRGPLGELAAGLGKLFGAVALLLVLAAIAAIVIVLVLIF